MSGAPWMGQLLIASLGMAFAGLAALLTRRLLKRDPALAYTLACALLVTALALLPVQWALRGAAAAWGTPIRGWITRVFEPTPSAPEPPGRRIEWPLIDDRSLLVDLPLEREFERTEARGAAASRHDRPELAAASLPSEYGILASMRAPLPPAHPAASRAPSHDAVPETNRAASSSLSLERLRGLLDGRLALAIYCAGLLWVVVGRALRLLRTLRLVHRSERELPPELSALWSELAASEPVAARVVLRVSREISSPACFGWWRPVLLVPHRALAQISPEALRWALRHELVHIARGDTLAAVVQALATSLFWFHPAAWWLSAEVGRLRELSCDLAVVQRCGHRRSYAHALLEHAAALHGHLSAIDAGPHSAGVRCALLHWGRSPSQIERRIEMLTVDSKGPDGRRLRGGRWLACSLFALPLLTQLGAAATLLPGDGPTATATTGTVNQAVAPRAVATSAVATADATAPHAMPARNVPVSARAIAPSAVEPAVASDDRAARPVRVRVKRPAAAGNPNVPAEEVPAIAPPRVAHDATAARAAAMSERIGDLAMALREAATAGRHDEVVKLQRKLQALVAAQTAVARLAVAETVARSHRDRAIEPPACADACEEACEAACEEACEESCEEACEVECEVECEEPCDAMSGVEFPEFSGFEEFGDLAELSELGELDELRGIEEPFAAAQAEFAKAMSEVDGELAATLAEARAELAEAATHVDAAQADAMRQRFDDAFAQARQEALQKAAEVQERAAVQFKRHQGEYEEQMRSAEARLAEARAGDGGALSTREAAARERALAAEQRALAQAERAHVELNQGFPTPSQRRRVGNQRHESAERAAMLRAQIEALQQQLNALQQELEVVNTPATPTPEPVPAPPTPVAPRRARSMR